MLKYTLKNAGFTTNNNPIKLHIKDGIYNLSNFSFKNKYPT